MTDQSGILRDRASVSHISLMVRPYGAPRIHLDENAASAAPEPAVIPAPADAGSSMSLADAARSLSEARKPKPQSADGAEPATAEQELSDEDNAGPNGSPGETEDIDPDAERLPPIERPRSWSKDDDDDWNALPRERQEKIARSERAREADINRRIKEAADKLNGVTAKEKAAEQARQQYEAKIQDALKVLEREQLRDFPDIRTIQDMSDLAKTDPVRYLQWDAHQRELAAQSNAAKQADERKAQEKQSERTTYAEAQNKLLLDLVPEMKDPAKASDMRTRAVAMLVENGFTNDELSSIARTDEGFKLLTDARLQKVIADALKFSDIQRAKKTAVAQPVPPVQRPGTARPSGNASSERLQALDRQLESSGSLKAAQELRAAQVASRARRAS